MKTIRLYAVFTSLILLVCSCKKETINLKIDPPFFVYEEDGVRVNTNVNVHLFEDNSLYIENEKIKIYIEELRLDSFPFNMNSYSFAAFSPQYPFIKYWADINDEFNGYLILTEIDRAKQTISGHFEFIGIKEKEENKKIEILNGVFEEISFQFEEGRFREGRVDAVIDQIPFKYLVNWTYDNSLLTIVTTMSPNGHSSYIHIPKNFDSGEYPITGSILGDHDAIVFQFNGAYSIPRENCKIIIEAFDDKQKLLKANVSGTFESSSGDVLELEKFQWNVQW